MPKQWTDAEIRTLAKQTVDGRHQFLNARGEFLHAIVGTAQAELGGKSGKDGQLAALRAVYHRFKGIVEKTIASDEVLIEDGFARKEIGLERNRRMNFTRSSYGTIKRWLRADGHDLMKLDSNKVSKSQLERESPPPKKHTLNSKRINARAKKHLGDLLSFTREVAKDNQPQAIVVVEKALEQLIMLNTEMRAERKTTTDATTAARESRPLRISGKIFELVGLPTPK